MSPRIGIGSEFPVAPTSLGEQLLPQTTQERDRILADGGTIEDGLLTGLVDPVLRTLDEAGQLSDLFFFGTAGAREVVSGSVATLYDFSGDANDATQGTSSNRPSDNTSSNFGGHVVANFDGTDDKMSTPIVGPYAQPYTVITVAQVPTDDGASHPLTDGLNGARSIVVIVRFDNTDQLHFHGGQGKYRLPSTDPHYWVGRADGANSELWEDGSSLGVQDAGGNDFEGLHIGSNLPAGGTLHGNILWASNIVVTADITGGNVQSEIESIISSYYGL